MQIETGTRLQDLGQEGHAARRIFRRLGVAADITGNPTVAELCEAAGVSLKDFARALAAMRPPEAAAEDLAGMPLRDLVHHIVDRHHAYTRQSLARLEELAGAADGLPPDLPHHFRHLREDLLRHLDMEERVLFPALLEEGGLPPFSTLDDLHRMALGEHEAAEELFQNIAILTHGFAIPRDAAPELRSLLLGLRDLEEDLFLHIHLENHVLFPRAIRPPGHA